MGFATMGNDAFGRRKETILKLFVVSTLGIWGFAFSDKIKINIRGEMQNNIQASAEIVDN